MPVQKSDVWEYFDEISGSKNVKCKRCGQVLERNNSSTTSMKRHLQQLHGLLKEVETNAANKVTTLDRFLKKEDEEQKIAEEMVAKMMIRHNCSILFVEGPEVKKQFAL